MREVLRAEFGDLAPLVRRIPRPALAPTSALWRALAAIGVGWIVGAIGTAVLALVWDLVEPSRISGEIVPAGRAIAQVIATAAAVAVAWSGGRRPLAILIGFEVVLLGLDLARLATSVPFARERGLALEFYDPARAVVGRWPLLVGSLIGIRSARWVGIAAGAANPLLEAAGVRVALSRVAAGLFGLAVPFADERYLPIAVALPLAGAMGAGVVVAVRAARVLGTALLLAALAIAAWIWPLGFSQVTIAIDARVPIAHLLLTLLPVAEATLIVMTALVISLARSARRSLAA